MSVLFQQKVVVNCMVVWLRISMQNIVCMITNTVCILMWLLHLFKAYFISWGNNDIIEATLSDNIKLTIYRNVGMNTHTVES